MNVVDSSGWLEYFANGPNATFFADPRKLRETLRGRRDQRQLRVLPKLGR